MAKSSVFLDFSLLKTNANFRAIFIARMLSVFALGMLSVGVPIQVQEMTGSTFQVGMAVALDGVGMFIGLILGGVLADRFDRRKLILFARGTCGLGFVALSINGFSDTPSLLALYVLAAWDGFFGALGMTALMAVIPILVGREHLPAAGALSMLTVRLGAILSPALGGVIIVAGGVGWNFAIAAIGTLATLIPLMRLPSLRPATSEPEPPLRALIGGVRFVCSHHVVGWVVLIGMLVSVIGAMRILFPTLANDVYHAGPSAVGLMFSAVPLGAMLGAFTSGWVSGVARPGLILLLCACGAFLSVASLGLVGHLVPALLALVCYGYLQAITGLLQFTLIQTHTPDPLLGRVNSLVTAQDVTGDSVGALGLGLMGRIFAPAMSILMFGGIAGLVILLALLVRPLRQCTFGEPDAVTQSDETEDKPATSA
ncbi:enterobactin transporter EntS [Pectobacterium parmentieri]|uniref:enterobactin transporter EntS n=1 Tax=Pectobacterium parmentieri TaxID=1905730 RepID=UPI0001B121CB|nr:enterobactin transporter EntS [Pectobacterium parmentieri]ACX89464.1 major facilitator superfamily MFS_1 [Pectobacterium parmentieri WPP163]AYH02867.1 enterobactin transporter EntS [Pectobacterium parmentieri]AYH29127.1 enterobactin transporter EntS [Pectobacterium parmentieri]AYH33544.1 enterobactin transporter EntS [Pectobacterium parmentieri]MBI0469105.1 enterobactin transporter EntS [Pectobacterium parmentieri]